MSTTVLTLEIVDRLTGGRLGTFDVPCPVCGPDRLAAINRRRPVLRVWRLEPGFAGFHCARCGERGHTRDSSAPSPDPVRLAAARRAAAERERTAAIERLDKARWLWSKRQPIADTIAKTYLREARGYHGTLPATLGSLPARGKHGPAMIAAFGFAEEPEPGRLAITPAAVLGVHITRLAPDGSGKAGTERDKIMVGRSVGVPIVLAPPNDQLGLAIAEGIEDALSVHEATGLGAWAAGAASRLQALADAVPGHIDFVTIVADADRDGRRHAAELLRRLEARSLVRATIVTLAAPREAA
jgi:hypothetical protein